MAKSFRSCEKQQSLESYFISMNIIVLFEKKRMFNEMNISLMFLITLLTQPTRLIPQFFDNRNPCILVKQN